MPAEVPPDLVAAFEERNGVLRMRELSWRTARPGDAEYPDRLEEVPHPPKRLWIAGRALHEAPPGVAIIGSRRANGYGLDVARRLGADFAAGGTAVISGMALGADAAAHEGALSAGGWTIAVLGSGIDVCYPTNNARLYVRIAQQGTIVTEQPPGETVARWTLSDRNRIIAGLAVAVIVVQAAERSGTLGTVDFALQAGRDVLAVPGNIDWPQSRGVHRLLKDGANICTSAADLQDDLRRKLRWESVVDRAVPDHLSESERAVLAVLSDGACTREQVCTRAGLDVATALRAVSALELAGYVGEVPGGAVRRLR